MSSPTATRLEGVLRLGLVRREGATYVAEQYDRAPLKVVRPFVLQDGRVLLQIVNTTAGVLGGDAYRLDLTVGPGAKAVVVHQSATKVHSMASGMSATETIRIQIEAGGELEFYPGLTIPFPEADFRQTLEVHLAEGAKFGCLDLRAMGRVSRGEHLAFRRLSCRVRVYREGRPCYMDALELNPGQSDVGGMGVLEGHRYLASGYWCWDVALKHQSIETPFVTLVTGLPPVGHLYLRAMAHEGIALKEAVACLLRTQRAAWGLSPVPAVGGFGWPTPPG